MATTFTIKRKLFAENPGDKKGMSTGGKIALGIGATAGTAALAFGAARRGNLNFINKNISTRANQAYGNLGKKFMNGTSERFQNLGNRMRQSAIKQQGKVGAKTAVRNLGTIEGETAEALAARQKAAARLGAQQEVAKLNGLSGSAVANTEWANSNNKILENLKKAKATPTK